MSIVNISAMDSNELSLLLKSSTNFNSNIFFEKILRFCEVNNQNLPNRIFDIWGQEALSELYSLIIIFFYKELSGDHNFWRSVNLLSKLSSTKDFHKYFHDSTNNTTSIELKQSISDTIKIKSEC